MQETDRGANTTLRRLFSVFLLAMLVFLAGGGWLFVTQKRRFQAAAEANLGAIARLKVDEIIQWRKERLSDAAGLMENPLVSPSILQGKGPFVVLLRSLKAHGQYSGIQVVDARGTVLFDLEGRKDPLAAEALRAVEEALRTRAPVLSELHECPEGNGPHLDVIAPFFTGDVPAHAPLGAVVLQCDASDFLYPMIRSWPGSSASAETLLVRRDGDDVLFLNDLRHRRDAAMKLRIPLTRTDTPAVMAVLGREGTAQGLDYRGTPVVSAQRAIPHSAWFLVAKEDAAEVFAVSRFSAFLILALTVVLAATALAVVAALWQRNQKARLRARLLAESARRLSDERYRTTLVSVGDGVISTDIDGTVEFMNPSAEALTGWRAGEALGRPLEEIFSIVQEQTRRPVENPVRRVIRDGGIVGLSNHTLLIARDGREHAISDSGAPIRSSDGKVVGVVLVFREVSVEERSRRERETTLRLLHLLNEQSLTHELVQNITKFLQEWTGCEAVGVRLRDGEDYPYYETRGFPPTFVSAERYLCERDPAGNTKRDGSGNPVLPCMCGTVLRGRFDPALPFFTAKGSFWTNSTSVLLASTTEADRQARTRDRCNGKGYESVALFRLRHAEETLGLLQVNDRARGRFTPALIEFLENAADQIAIALAHRRVQADLIESEKHYRSLFENMLNGFAFCRMLFDGDPPHDFLYLEVNDAFEKLTGLKDVVGRRVSEVIPGVREADPELLERYARVALSGVPDRFEIKIASLEMWFSVSVYSPRKEYFVAIFDVTTERKHAEAERQLLSSAVEQAADMIVIIDSSGIVQYVNPSFETVTGFGGAEALGHDARTLLDSGGDTPFSAAIEKTLASGDPWQGRIVNTRRDGTRYTLDASVSPLRDSSGRIVNFISVGHDSTRELLLEEQLRQAQKMESVGRLAGGVAHDFNNMLQVIVSYVELSLAQTDATDPLRRNLQQIRRAADRSAESVRQLLTFARKQMVSPKVLETNAAISATLGMLRRLIGENIDLVWTPGHAVGRVRIDPSQLDQVLANLAANARDAIAGVGKLTIETSGIEIDKAYCAAHAGLIPGRYVLLGVSDNGRGMNKETLSHLFEPFFTTKGVGEGTGLGLASVYGIVNQNNGFINVYSEPGQGTTFKIYLPSVEEDAAVREESSAGEIPGGKETVLVVEVEPTILQLSRMMLGNLGYSVLLAATPREAISLVESSAEPVHLLITDMVMPEMNGQDLARRLVALRPGLRCLFMSGYTADAIAHQGMLGEDVHFISKPFSISLLAKKVREALS